MFQRFAVLVPLAILVGLATISLSPDVALAQDCARECHVCNGGGREGSGYDTNGGYDMRCVAGNLCVVCGAPGALVAEARSSEATILRAVLTARPEELEDVVGIYRDRILFHAPRQLLGIIGAGCQENQVATVAFLSPGMSEALSQLGVRSLKSFYREAKPQVPLSGG